MLEKLYPYRFVIFFVTLLSILFGTLIVPVILFEEQISPLFFLANLTAGLIMIQKKKWLYRLGITLLIMGSLIFIADQSGIVDQESIGFMRMAIFFSYYVIVSYEIIFQVWYSKKITRNIIFGLISGYISLGLIGFFICITIEMMAPGSFQGGLINAANPELISEQLMYYSYVTLLTIGYGDILPMTPIAQKAAVLIGLLGQFYLVIITSIVVGKYVSQQSSPKE
jgi:Ion channel